MQTEFRSIAPMLILMAAVLFIGAVFSGYKHRATLAGLATLGLGIAKTMIQIETKERTAH